MNTNKNVIALFAIFTQMLVMTVAFAESSEKKQTGILKPVNKMSILMQTKANGLNTTKVPVVKAKPHKAIVAQTKSKTNSEPRPGSNSIVSPHSPRPGNEQWGGGAGGEEITLPIRAPVAKAKTRKSPVLQSKRFPERPSYLRSDNKMDKQPVVSSSQKMQNSLQKNKVTSIKAKPNKAGASQVKPLLVNRLGKSHAKGATNAAAVNLPESLQENGINVPDRHIDQANQARGIKEMSEVARDRLGILNQENEMDSEQGRLGNSITGFTDSEGGQSDSQVGGMIMPIPTTPNRRSRNGTGDMVKAPIASNSVRGAGAGASSLISAPPGANSTATDTDTSSTETQTWTGRNGTRHNLETSIHFGGEGGVTQTYSASTPNGGTVEVELNQRADGSGTTYITKLDSEGVVINETRKVIPPRIPPATSESQDPNADNGDGEWADFVESINGIKKPATKMPVYVNPGKQEETVSNDAPTVPLSISTDQLVTNPDPENSRGDAVAGRAMRPEKIMEGVGPGGHIGKGQ